MIGGFRLKYYDLIFLLGTKIIIEKSNNKEIMYEHNLANAPYFNIGS